MQKVKVICVVFLVAGMVSPAMAAFSGGLEAFNGTVLDTATWEFYDSYGDGSASQNNKLTLTAPWASGMAGHSTWVDYTTIVDAGKIGIGETVAVEITPKVYPTNSQRFGIYLTDNSNGTGGSVTSDTNWIGLFRNVGTGLGPTLTGSMISAMTSQDISSAGRKDLINPSGLSEVHAIDTTYIYMIQYISQTQLRFSVFDSSRNLVDAGVQEHGSTTPVNPLSLTIGSSMPDDMYISLQAYTSTVDFDNVRNVVGGDANLDGAVNVDDLGILASNWGQTSGMAWTGADFNGDAQVNVDDLGILAANWGTGTAPVVPTPEPATLAILAIGGIGMLRRRIA